MKKIEISIYLKIYFSISTNMLVLSFLTNYQFHEFIHSYNIKSFISVIRKISDKIDHPPIAL